MASLYPAYNTIPDSYDLKFLEQKSGIKILGVGNNDDGTVVITYDNPTGSGRFEAMTETIADYEVDYLEVALPRRIEEVRLLRDNYISGFTINGLHIELDLETKANIVGSVSGLDRNPQVAGIDWSLGGGQFVFLSRAMIYGIADAAFLHIQACFTQHKAKVTLLKAATNLSELAAVSITSGWPSGPGLPLSD